MSPSRGHAMTDPDDVLGPWRPAGSLARFGARAFAHPTAPDALVWLPAGRGLVTFAGWAVWRWSEDGALRAVASLPSDQASDDAPRGWPVAAMLASSDDGEVVALPFDDGTLGVLRGGAWSHTRMPPRVSCLAVTPSGRALLFGTMDGLLVVTDSLGRALRQARVVADAVTRVASRDDEEAFVGAAGSLACVRLADLSVRWRDRRGARAIALNAGRDRIAVDTPRPMRDAAEDELHTVVERDGAVTMGASGPVRILDASSGRLRAEVLPAERPTRFVAFAADDSLVGVSDREFVRAPASASRFLGTPWRYPGFVATACASPSGEVIASLHTGSPFVHRWDARTAQPLGATRKAPARLVATDDGCFHSDDGRVFDARRGTDAAWLPRGENGETPRAEVSHDGRSAAVVHPGRGIALVAIDGAAAPRLIPVRGTVMAVAWARDGRSLAVWSQINTRTDSTEVFWEVEVERDACVQRPLLGHEAWTGGHLACGARGAVYAASRGATGIAWRPGALGWWDGAAWATDAVDAEVLPGVRRARGPGGERFVLAATAEERSRFKTS